MITNERQYAITKRSLADFERALVAADVQNADLAPALQQAMRESIISQMEELHRELSHFEMLRSGSIRSMTVSSLQEISKMLIGARIAAGLTQKELGDLVDMPAQQVQRYEATGYSSADLDRLVEISEALGIQFKATAEFELPVSSPSTVTFRSQTAGSAASRKVANSEPRAGLRPSGQGAVVEYQTPAVQQGESRPPWSASSIATQKPELALAS